jgi:hypothetical protein
MEKNKSKNLLRVNVKFSPLEKLIIFIVKGLLLNYNTCQGEVIGKLKSLYMMDCKQNLQLFAYY